MKRNHGLKVKDKDKGKEKTKERTATAKDDNCSPTSADLSGGGTFLFRLNLMFWGQAFKPVYPLLIYMLFTEAD
jgi:hypothetical protein